MDEMETCVLCNTKINTEGISGMDAYIADCPVCGRYKLDGVKSEILKQMSKDDKPMLSAYVREINEFGSGECSLLDFDEQQMSDIIEQYKKKSLEDKVDNFIKYLMKKTEYFGQEIKQSGPSSNKCFVAMSCSDDLRDAYDNGIKKAVEEAGYVPVFIEREEHNKKICDLIIANILECKFLVADVTGQRQNVYYEAGFAHGLNRQVIWNIRAVP